MTTVSVTPFMKKRWRAILALTGLALATSVTAMKLTASEELEADNLSRALPVRTAQIALENGYNAKRSFTGRAIAGQISSLSFELGGTLEAVHVDIGSEVEKGQVLAELDTARLKARRMELQAELDEVHANQKLAERTLDRARKTFEQGHASAQRLDEAEANAIGLRARERRLEAAIGTLNVDIEKSAIRSPYAGVITLRTLDEGTVLTAGTQVLELTQSGQMEAHIGMPAQYARAIEAGAPVYLLNSDRSRIEGAKVRDIVPVITGQTRTMMVTFNLPEDSVPRGELINAVVRDWQEQSGSWLPIRALAADVRGLWRVYKVTDGANGPHVRFENVQILYTEGNRVFVTGTLSDGDIVIADGIDRLAPGQRVEVLETISANATAQSR